MKDDITKKAALNIHSIPFWHPRTSATRATPYAVQRHVFGQFLKFTLVGILNTGLHYGVFFLLYHVTEINYLIASSIGYCTGMINSFILNRRWTFASSNNRISGEMLKFLTVNLAALGTNGVLLFALVTFFLLKPPVAQVAAIIGSLSVNFIGNKLWTFAPTDGHPSRSRSELVKRPRRPWSRSA